MHRSFLAFDPGVKGAAVLIREIQNDLLTEFLTTKEQQIAVLKAYCPGDLIVGLEQVHGFPKDGPKQAFTFGQSYGEIIGICKATGHRIRYITPQIWQSAMGCLTGGNKNVSKKRALQLFPLYAKHITHTTADALLIAEYLRRVS